LNTYLTPRPLPHIIFTLNWTSCHAAAVSQSVGGVKLFSVGFGWVTPLMRRGAQRQLQFLDLFVLEDELHPSMCLSAMWMACKVFNPPPPPLPPTPPAALRSRDGATPKGSTKIGIRDQERVGGGEGLLEEELLHPSNCRSAEGLNRGHSRANITCSSYHPCFRFKALPSVAYLSNLCQEIAMMYRRKRKSLSYFFLQFPFSTILS